MEKKAKIFSKYTQMSVQAKSAIWFTMCSILQKGIAFITVPIFTRQMTDEQYGTYSLYLSWLQILTIITSLYLYYGVFNNAMVKFENDRNRYISSMQGLTMTITAVVFGIYLVFQKMWVQLLGLAPTLIILMFVEMLVTPSIDFWAGRQRFEYKYQRLVAVTLGKSIANPLLGLGKPNLLYVKDLYAGLSQSNYWKYENQTSGGLKTELPGVWKSNGSKTDINNTDSSETDLIYSVPYVENTSKEMREDERYRLYFQDKLEIPILEKNFPHDREILMEILELLVETVTSRKKFLRICGEEKPKEVVKSRLMKLDSMHIQYVMECLKSNTTQVRNIKQYLLATLYNAPTTIDSYYAAQVRHDFGWGGRSN